MLAPTVDEWTVLEEQFDVLRCGLCDVEAAFEVKVVCCWTPVYQCRSHHRVWRAAMSAQTGRPVFCRWCDCRTTGGPDHYVVREL